VHLSRIGPRRESRDDVELSQKPTDDFVGICLGAQAIELRHDLYEGLLHISELRHERTEKTEDVVKKGDRVKVKLIDRDERGRLRLSMKALLPRPEGMPEPEPTAAGEGGDGGERPRREGGDRGGRPRGGGRGGERSRR